jgi:hypothetical protein
MRVFSGEQSSAAGRTNGIPNKPVRKYNSFIGNPVEVRRFNKFIAVCTDGLERMIISHYKQDIGPLNWFFGLFTGGQYN